MTCLFGEPRSLLLVRRDSQPPAIPVELPAGVCVSAAEVRPQRPIQAARVIESDVAAAIGLRLIQRLLNKPGAANDPRGGLAAVTTQEYVEQLRMRLPPRLKGKQVLDMLGSWDDANGPLEAERTYKPRSRAEHHIYENERVQDFIACLHRARRSGDEAALADAGTLMFASHWSESQRYGLGSVETDAVVTAVRKLGPAGGLFGARLAATGDGCLMVILMRDTEAAREALDRIARDLSQRFGSPISVRGGSDGGACIQGAHVSTSMKT